MTAPQAPQISLPWDAADPFPFYERRRAEGSVVWDDTAQAWLVLSYPLAQQILTDPAGWTSNPMANPTTAETLGVLGGEDLFGRSMINTDGANHKRLRGCLRDVFTRTFIAGLQTGVEALAATIVDAPPSNTAFDFMSDIALSFPIAVAAAWLGLDDDTAQLLREESPAISRMLNDSADIDAVDAATAAFTSLLTELLPLAADRRTNPGDDLLSFIAADLALELDDVVVTALLIAVAGHETTANLLGSALFRLLTHPEPIARDGALVNELLRLDGPVQAVGRTATRDHVLNDITIHVDQRVLVLLAAANRDPDLFENPNEFRTDRCGPPPLSFGHGPHYCLGAALARLEITTALQHILARRPRLAGTPAWRDTRAFRGPQSLPLVFQNS